MNPVISYRRFSDKQQRKGDSLRRQTQAAQDYCLEHGLTLSDMSFEDLGVSAYHSDHTRGDKGFAKLLDALAESKIHTPCTLLVENLDRLSRANINVALRQLMSIVDYGVDVITLTDNRKYTSDMQMEDYIYCIITMQRAFDESDLKSKRLKAAHKRKREQPFESKRSKRCPFWLTTNALKTEHIFNDFAPLVREAFELSAQGVGAYTIAKRFNEKGWLTPKGKEWESSVIIRFLSNRQCIGEHQPCRMEGRKQIPEGEPIPDYFPRVVSDDVFFASLGQLRKRHKTQTHGSTLSHLNLLKDVGKCADCGSNLVLKTQDARKYLMCKNSAYGRCNAPKFNIAYLRDWLRECWLTPAFFKHWSNASNSKSDTRKLDTLRGELRSQETALESLLEGLTDTTNAVVIAHINKRTEAIKQLSDDVKSLEVELMSKPSAHKVDFKHCLALIDAAFIEGNAEEQLTARNRLQRLMERLPLFTVKSDKENGLEFVVAGNGEYTFTFKAIKNAYIFNKKVNAVWSMTGIIHH
ncbi:recombinase family protein [Enterovibrio baiacu]|uniref:recombinase family protein n=1 Tax=Enterovibrio baiacu TaxID=2491023 RepID=UPI0010108B8B|nr:recombinase family protein [Enterovibrio baiacu]MBE1275108.1 recombinase family protein [Enterovibrio baiacu]